MIQSENTNETTLFIDIHNIIQTGKQRLATTLNAEICMMHWQVGMRIKEDVLFNQRAEYGKEILKKLSIELTKQFGKGWSTSKLQQCVRAA